MGAFKKGYEQYYHLIDGNSVPFWLVETIRKWYNRVERILHTKSLQKYFKVSIKK